MMMMMMMILNSQTNQWLKPARPIHPIIPSMRSGIIIRKMKQYFAKYIQPISNMRQRKKKKNTIDGIVFDEVKNQGSSATYGRLCSHHYALNVGYAYCVHQQMNGSCCPIPSLVTNTRRFITVACTSLLQKSSALAFNQSGRDPPYSLKIIHKNKIISSIGICSRHTTTILKDIGPRTISNGRFTYGKSLIIQLNDLIFLEVYCTVSLSQKIPCTNNSKNTSRFVAGCGYHRSSRKSPTHFRQVIVINAQWMKYTNISVRANLNRPLDQYHLIFTKEDEPFLYPESIISNQQVSATQLMNACFGGLSKCTHNDGCTHYVVFDQYKQEFVIKLENTNGKIRIIKVNLQDMIQKQ
eukprot:931318_1